MEAMGLLGTISPSFGLEGSGVVQQVGVNVKGLKVGDRVMMMHGGCFSTRLTVPAKRCVKIPDRLSWKDAATMPCIFSTVVHALIEKAALQRDQTILIHSACGGIGLAAIQICQLVHAKVR
jgi:NADPH:quinone reductase-like Zn-dependent oxidoreductase